MKAKVKSTGEIITIVAISTEDKNMQCYGNDGIMRTEPFCVDDLLIIPEYTIDWEQRRYEIAKAAMVGTLAFPVIEGVNPNPNATEICKLSVTLADALIEELKKESK